MKQKHHIHDEYWNDDYVYKGCGLTVITQTQETTADGNLNKYTIKSGCLEPSSTYTSDGSLPRDEYEQHMQIHAKK